MADENMPGSVVSALRADGADVLWILEGAPGLPDRDVLAWAAREKRILISLDKDFGDLARSEPLDADCGVVLLRVRTPATADAAQALVAVLASRIDWAGHFSVIEAGRIRRRALVTRQAADRVVLPPRATG